MTIEIGRCSVTPNPDLEDTGAPFGKQQKPPQLVYGSAEEILHEQLLRAFVPHVNVDSSF